MNWKKIMVIVIVVLFFALAAIMIWRYNYHQTETADEPSMRVAVLYATKPDNTYILKDTIGELWELDSQYNVQEDDTLLLEVTGKKVTHVWREVVVIDGDGETN